MAGDGLTNSQRLATSHLDLPLMPNPTYSLPDLRTAIAHCTTLGGWAHTEDIRRALGCVISTAYRWLGDAAGRGDIECEVRWVKRGERWRLARMWRVA